MSGRQLTERGSRGSPPRRFAASPPRRLAGTLVYSVGQRSEDRRIDERKRPSRPVSWSPNGGRLHRTCATASSAPWLRLRSLTNFPESAGCPPPSFLDPSLLRSLADPIIRSSAFPVPLLPSVLLAPSLTTFLSRGSSCRYARAVACPATQVHGDSECYLADK